jgi:probable O-glycosylation ligase (exosortase A-associated)
VLPNLTHPLSVGALAFLGVGLLAQAGAVNPALGWGWIDQFARLVLVCLLTVTLLSSRRRYQLMVAVVGGSLGLLAAKAGLAWLAGGGPQFGEGLAGSFTDNNGYALGVAMVIPFLVASGQNATRRSVRWGFYVAALLSAFTVAGTYSRGGFLALGAATLTFVALNRHRLAALAGLAALTLALLALAPFSDAYFHRLSTIETYQEAGDESALGRLHFWRVAVDMASDRPLGVGLGNYEAAYDQYDTSEGRFGQRRAVHSSHFEVLAETGWLGAAVWVGLLTTAFGLALRVRRRSALPTLSEPDARFLRTSATALMASMAAFVVGGAFIALALNEVTWFTFAMVAALDRLSSAMTREHAWTPAVQRGAMAA